MILCHRSLTDTVIPRAGWLCTLEYELTKSSISSAVKMLGWMKLSREYSSCRLFWMGVPVSRTLKSTENYTNTRHMHRGKLKKTTINVGKDKETKMHQPRWSSVLVSRFCVAVNSDPSVCELRRPRAPSTSTWGAEWREVLDYMENY